MRDLRGREHKGAFPLSSRNCRVVSMTLSLAGADTLRVHLITTKSLSNIDRIPSVESRI